MKPKGKVQRKRRLDCSCCRRRSTVRVAARTGHDGRPIYECVACGNTFSAGKSGLDNPPTDKGVSNG